MKRTEKRSVRLLCLILAMMMLLAGCGTEPPAGKTGDPKNGLTLKVTAAESSKGSWKTTVRWTIQNNGEETWNLYERMVIIHREASGTLVEDIDTREYTATTKLGPGTTVENTQEWGKALDTGDYTLQKFLENQKTGETIMLSAEFHCEAQER